MVDGVLGIEGDYSVNGNLDNYLASLRTRFGWTTGSFLFYGTAGVAFSGQDNVEALGVGASGGNGGSGGEGGSGGAGALGGGYLVEVAATAAAAAAAATLN